MLVEHGEYDKTSRILSCPLLRNLWPSLLLHYLHNLPNIPITAEADTWQKSLSICESLEFLLNKCCYAQYEYDEPILVKLNACLNSRLAVVKWILEYHKNNAITAADQNLSVKRILNGLQDYCILSVLKKSIDIHECDYNELENLLKDRDEAVRVFVSYRAMQIALKAIVASESNHSRTSKDTTLGYFSEMESLVNLINPLTLRLEVIENVFSMLFLRHDVHFNAAEGTAEEEDYNDTFSEKERQSSAYESRESETHRTRYGFLANRHSVKKILNHLKRCIVQVGIDFAKLRREIGDTKELQAVQKRILAIDKALADGFWRLELLTCGDVIESHEELLIENAISSPTSESESDEKLSFSFRMKSKSIFYNQQNESSSEDGGKDLKSDVDVSSEAGSTDANGTKRRKKSKNLATTPTGGTSPKNGNSRFIVNLMLASKESLVLQCLWKADYARAQQVIEVSSQVSYGFFKLFVRVFFENCRFVLGGFVIFRQRSRWIVHEILSILCDNSSGKADGTATTATTPSCKLFHV